MGSEFDLTVRMEEIPETRIIEIDLPGFRREDLRVQVNNRGNLVISGERGAKEMEEMTKMGGKSEKMQRGGHEFRKVISVPQNLNFDGITAKFWNERLRVSLPLLHVSDQQSPETLPGSGKADQSLQSNVDRSSPAGQQDSRKESVAPAQEDHSGRDLEAIRQGEDKEKPTVAAEKSNELLQETKSEAPQQDLETLMSGLPWECRHPVHEKKDECSADEGKVAEKVHRVVGKEGNGDGIGCIVEGYIRHQQHEEKDDDEKCSSWRSETFPDLKQIPFPLNSSTSTFSMRGVLIASTVVILSVGFYMTYKSRSRHHI